MKKHSSGLNPLIPTILLTSLVHPRRKELAKEGSQKEKTMLEQFQPLFAGVWDMIPLLTKLFNKEETDCKAFAVIGL